MMFSVTPWTRVNVPCGKLHGKAEYRIKLHTVVDTVRTKTDFINPPHLAIWTTLSLEQSLEIRLGRVCVMGPWDLYSCKPAFCRCQVSTTQNLYWIIQSTIHLTQVNHQINLIQKINSLLSIPLMFCGIYSCGISSQIIMASSNIHLIPYRHSTLTCHQHDNLYFT